MPVPGSINDLSTSAGSNSPPGSESPTLVDDYLRFHAACIATLRDTRVSRTSATGSLRLPSGTTAQRDGSAEESFTRWNTDLDCIEVYNGSAWVQLGWQTTVVAHGGVNAQDFPNIPPWAREINVGFAGLSVATAQRIKVQAGTSSGMATSGYSVYASQIGSIITDDRSVTDGFPTSSPSPAGVFHGTLRLILLNAATNTWSGSARFAKSDVAGLSVADGVVSLSGPLDRIRVFGEAGALFDGGSISMSYRA